MRSYRCVTPSTYESTETLVDTRQTCKATRNGTNIMYDGDEDDITIPNCGHSTFDQALGPKKQCAKN